MTRERLPNRRGSVTFAFDCGPHRYVATISFFTGTDRLAEIFLGNGRAGSDIDAAAKDSAVVANIALQHGFTPRRSARRAATPSCARSWTRSPTSRPTKPVPNPISKS
jgi:hypothetical protein